MARDPKFILLKYQSFMDADIYEHKILGAIVKNYLSPATDSVPEAPDRFMVKSHPYFERPVTDFLLKSKGSISKEAALSVQAIGEVSITGDKESVVHLAGKLIRWRRIRQLEDFWANLKNDGDVRKKAPGWVPFFGQTACLIVGIMISEDLELSTEEKRSLVASGRLKLPVQEAAAATGAAPPTGDQFDPQLSASTNASNTTTLEGKVKERSIFAVEVMKVTTELFHRKRLQLTTPTHEVDDTRFLGEEDDEDEEALMRPVESDELVLKEFTSDEYERMSA